MKSSLKILLGLTLITLSLSTQAQIPHLVDRSKSGIIAYFKSLIQNNAIIVGQLCGNGRETAQGFDQYVETINTSANKYPALVGFEYGFTPHNDFNLINQYVAKHWNKGGLVTINWSADNPWVDGYSCRWNSIDNKGTIDFKKLLKNAPDSKEKDSYRRELASVGRALQQLKYEGITVLWRPFHEMNGMWFWWGIDNKTPTNTRDFALLWKDMYDYFTQDLGLTNLIWIYSPNAYVPSIATIAAQYPGTKYVDLVGADIYTAKPSFDDYDALKALNKPIVIAEVGPNKNGYGNFDECDIINTYKGKAAYFLQWSSWPNAKVAIVDNLKYKEMLALPNAITLDKMK